MSKKKSDHIHKYRRMNIGAFDKPPYLIFKCIKPGCSHYVPVNQSLGQVSECNRCHEVFVMTKSTQTFALPHCISCTKRKKVKDEDVESITEFLNKSGI